MQVVSSSRKETKSSSRKQEPSVNKLDNVAAKDDNSHLKEMKYRLDIYRAEVEESIKSGNVIEYDNFKKNFYTSLENLLNQIVYIRDKKLRDQKIETVFKWYQLKTTFFKNLNPVDTRTSQNYYEHHPEIDESAKSGYYEAQNYPQFFEKEHRTEEGGLLPPKDRLKEFKTKHIEKKDIKEYMKNDSKEKDRDIIPPFIKDSNNADKQRLQSATSSIALRSTQYTASQTHTKFFTPSNIPVEASFDPVREIKSSYSVFRPKYDYAHLMIEKNSIQAKHKELAEKRNQEEMKEFMNEFGLNKARYKEEAEKKFETQNLINYYENLIKPQQEEVEEKEFVEEKVQEVKKTVFLDGNEKIDSKDINTLDIAEDNSNCRVNPPPIIKVDLNNIKNLGEDNKLNINREEVNINIKLKNAEGLKKESLDAIKNKNEKLPLDVVATVKAIDPVFNSRHTYSQMLDVKEVDNQKSEYKNNYNPLSAFDSANIEVMTLSPVMNKPKNRPATGYEFVRDNFDGDNLLGQRQTLTNFKQDDYTKLRQTLLKFNNTTVSFRSLKQAFLPPAEDKHYPKFFLPVAGAGLLPRPVDGQPKKRPKSRPKSRK